MDCFLVKAVAFIAVIADLLQELGHLSTVGGEEDAIGFGSDQIDALTGIVGVLTAAHFTGNDFNTVLFCKCCKCIGCSHGSIVILIEDANSCIAILTHPSEDGLGRVVGGNGGTIDVGGRSKRIGGTAGEYGNAGSLNGLNAANQAGTLLGTADCIDLVFLNQLGYNCQRSGGVALIVIGDDLNGTSEPAALLIEQLGIQLYRVQVLLAVLSVAARQGSEETNLVGLAFCCIAAFFSRLFSLGVFGRALSRRSFGSLGVSGRFFLCATGNQAQNHEQTEKHCNDLFHFLSSIEY